MAFRKIGNRIISRTDIAFRDISLIRVISHIELTVAACFSSHVDIERLKLRLKQSAFSVERLRVIFILRFLCQVNDAKNQEDHIQH